MSTEPANTTHIEPIKGLKHPAVKEARELSTSPGRQKHQAFAIEGLKNLQLALRLGKSLRSVFISQKSLLHFPQSALHDLARRNTPAYSASPSIIAKILATRYEPDSECVAVIQMEQWSLERLTSQKPQFVLLCDHVVDPRNLGVIIRTADAASADAVILTPGCADPYSRPAVRASTGSILNVPIVPDESPKASLKRLKEVGLSIIASSAVEGKPIWDHDLTQPAALILGNETAGVSPELRSLADSTLRIPIHGSAHSLNVAVACAVILFERLRQLQRPSP
jgi:TrmH family RNA methyltransferase